MGKASSTMSPTNFNKTFNGSQMGGTIPRRPEMADILNPSVRTGVEANSNNWILDSLSAFTT